MTEQPSEIAPLNIALLPHSPDRDERTCLIPSDVETLVQAGHSVTVPAATSCEPTLSVESFRAAGAAVAVDDDQLFAADLLVSLHPPVDAHIRRCTERHTLVGFLSLFDRPGCVAGLADRGVTSVALELVPRTTIAQSMDALSSQASLAGYAAVILAVSRISKAIPMMTTAAGTIRPAKILVLGAGVAGLQAIATAQRLGARVTAFDVRAAAGDQIRSLGAKFAPLPESSPEDAEDAGGYARQASDDQLARQRKHLTALCAASDIVITTAQVFGRPAPTLITADMIDAMAPGSVVVDAAAASGGNVEIARPDEEVHRSGVTIVADTILAARVARDASQVLSANMSALLKRIIDPATGRVKRHGEDDIADAVTVTRDGRITDDRVAERVKAARAETTS